MKEELKLNIDVGFLFQKDSIKFQKESIKFLALLGGIPIEFWVKFSFSDGILYINLIILLLKKQLIITFLEIIICNETNKEGGHGSKLFTFMNSNRLLLSTILSQPFFY